MMLEPDTATIPPEADAGDGDGDSGPYSHVTVTLMTSDGVLRTANYHTDGALSDAEIAQALIGCLHGIASQYGGDLPFEIARRTIGLGTDGVAPR